MIVGERRVLAAGGEREGADRFRIARESRGIATGFPAVVAEQLDAVCREDAELRIGNDASGAEGGKTGSDGARKIALAAVSATTTPAMRAFSPVPTIARLEMLTRRARGVSGEDDFAADRGAPRAAREHAAQVGSIAANVDVARRGNGERRLT